MKLKYCTTLIFMVSILKITAQSGYSLELNVKTIPTEEVTKNETAVVFSFFKNTAANKIKNSIRYKNSRFNYLPDSFYTTNNSSNYNWIENNFEFTHRISPKLAWEMELKTIAAFEKDLGISTVRILGGSGIKYEFNKNNSIYLGAKRMTPFGKAEVLPSIAFNSKLNATTVVTLGFPISKIKYSNNERNAFSLINTFDGEYYQLDQVKTIGENINASQMRFSQMTTALEYERNMDSSWYMSFQGGYGFNKKYALTDNRGTTKFNFDANDGYLFNIGIKYKP